MMMKLNFQCTKPSDPHNSQRIEVLVALAISFSPALGVEAAELLSDLGADDARVAEVRLRWCLDLAPAERAHWLRETISKARPAEMRTRLQCSSNLLHASHVVAALREEPTALRRALLKHLPYASSLTVDTPIPRFEDLDDKLSAVIQQTFLARFVFVETLINPTDLDLLDSVELVRFIRLLGVRETALACRGISSVEAIASFLRRFPTEEAQAIAAHMRALAKIALWRVRFAEGIVQPEIASDLEPCTMLDRAGMSLFALAMSGRDCATVRFTVQKIPFEGAEWLQRLLAAAKLKDFEQVLKVQVVSEIEQLATRLRSSSALLVSATNRSNFSHG